MANVHVTREQPRTKTSIITVRDVVRNAVYQLSADEPMLRVPYDLFRPVGPVHFKDGLIRYLQDGEIRSGRAGMARLGEARTDERVLLRLTGGASEHEWWLCQVTHVDGVDVD